MPGLIWSGKGEVIQQGAAVPDGSADGQFLLWNAAAGEWQAQSVTPGDIGAAAASHTHEWAGIASVGSLATGFAADGRDFVSQGLTKDIAYIQNYSGGVLLLVEKWIPGQSKSSSIWMLQRSASDVYNHQIAGSVVGTVSIVPGVPWIVRYAAPGSTGIELYYLFLPFGVR
jgi:hypothetical protein